MAAPKTTRIAGDTTQAIPQSTAAGDAPADLDDSAGIFMAEDRAGRHDPGELGDVQIRSADARAGDRDHHLVVGGDRVRDALDPERLARDVEDGSAHRFRPSV